MMQVKSLLWSTLLLTGLAYASAPDPHPMNVMPDKLARSMWQRQQQGQMQMQMQTMLTTLRPLSGKAFDVKWTELMIDHHQMALDMAQHELDMGKDARVKAAAQKVVDAQQKEITLMQGWLKSWTGQNYMPKPMPMNMAMSGNTASGGMDRWFLTGMIPHHQGALDMSLLAVPRTTTKVVRDMARHIRTMQTLEIREYQTLLKTVK